MPRLTQRRRYLLVQATTAVRVPLAIAVALLLLAAERTPAVLLGCLALLLAIEVSDSLDGRLARRYGLVSTWGEMFDPVVDSVSRLIVYWALAQAGLALAAVPLVMALRDVTVAYSRLWLATRGGSVSARWSGKIKATVQGVGAMVLVVSPLYDAGAEALQVVTSWVVLAVTAVSSIEYVRAALRAREGEGDGT